MSKTPWWQALQLRPEITSAAGQIEDVQMALGAAVYPSAEVPAPLYADPEHYGQITHPTSRLTALLADVAIRLAGPETSYTAAGALTRLNQGMGGGKSHALIGAWHLAVHPQATLGTDIGQAIAAAAHERTGQPLPSDLNSPVAVVLDLDNGTPGVRRPDVDGPYATTLFEKFLWRLFDGDATAFTTYREHWQSKDEIKKALASVGRPVLIVIDEIMDYIGNGLTGAGDEKLASQDMAFLRALLDSVNDVPHVAAVVAMIDPEKDRISLSADGKDRQKDLHQLLERNGRTATVNEDTDFTAILRRRLFTTAPTPAQAAETAAAFDPMRTDGGWSKVLAGLGADWTQDWAGAVGHSYPFHPQLMQLAEQEWAKNSGYQNVRSTIRVFAATVYALQRRATDGGWAPLLIGPGDLPMWNNEVREALLGSGLISDLSLEANYRSIIQGDITSLADAAASSGQARVLDDTVTVKESWGAANPHAHERAATLIAVASLVPRGSGRRGASEGEIKVASALPEVSYGVGDADGVIARLTDINSEASMASVEAIEGKGGQQRRYYLNPETGAKVVFRQHRQAITSTERDNQIAATAKELTTSGPFNDKLFVDADRSLPSDADRREAATATLTAAGIDDARSNRLVVLDPAGFSLRNGMSDSTLAAVEAASGLGPQASAVTWASSAVYAVVNTQRRRLARETATDYLAWSRTAASPELQANKTAVQTAQNEANAAHEALKRSLRRAFQHILFLQQVSPDHPRKLAEITLDNDAETALSGSTVWKELAERGKAFQPNQFTAKALLTNLADNDFGRPLNELRDAFYQSPRLPLLPGGDADLRGAIYAAVKAGDLRLVGADGQDRAVTGPEQINLTSAGLRLAEPLPAEPCDKCGKPDCPGTCQQTKKASCTKCGSSTCTGNCQTTPSPAQAEQVKVFLQANVDDSNRAQIQQVFETLYSGTLNPQISFVAVNIQLVVDADLANTLVENAEQAGAQQVTRKPAQQPPTNSTPGGA